MPKAIVQYKNPHHRLAFMSLQFIDVTLFEKKYTLSGHGLEKSFSPSFPSLLPASQVSARHAAVTNAAMAAAARAVAAFDVTSIM